MIRTAGITLPERPKKRATLKTVALLVRATVRMKNSAEEWKKSRKIQDALILKVEAMKKAEKEATKKAEKEGSLKQTASKVESARTPSRTQSSLTAAPVRVESTKRKTRKSSNGY
jgi:hypothetical protein